ncbi:hypothetical protein LP085_08825 [Achromobacter sp. MY14]|uniref:hypothetical protein n=1 Tax=unclassified Achromobacter TaxID=2626865 RepID=UPI001E4D10EC|nr:hypothetical protein [Achromobacter sp. MY14]MCD0496947.1 hypothetical protein [Achromobacter sp. MY14]
MADPTFFELFKSTWAQNGLTEGITDLQYKTGWAYIGSVPPSVEQFNKVQQVTDERLAWLYQQLEGLAAVTGRPLVATSSDALSYAQQNLNASNLTSGTVPVARLSGTASSLTSGAAAKWVTARTIAASGDATGSTTFDGSANASLSLTLAASGVTAGTYGNANALPTFTVDAKGRVSAAGEVALGNAATATKLATTRQFSVTGGATAAGVSFDGSGSVALDVTALDVSKATAGTLPVARGGTGLGTVAAGSYLMGAGADSLVQRTPAQVFSDIGVSQAIAAYVEGSFPRIYSIAALPATNVGPILVAEAAEVWIWVATSFFTGYRSPLCGRPLDGHTVAPLVNEIDAVGGVLLKAAYAGLWGYAQENGLVVTQANWEARRGGHYFVNVDENTFRVPDLRDMFRRFTGTDADTANARVLGSRQGDGLRSHLHTLPNATWDAFSGTSSMGSASGSSGTVISRSTTSAGGAETRPVNVAYHPRIHA